MKRRTFIEFAVVAGSAAILCWVAHEIWKWHSGETTSTAQPASPPVEPDSADSQTLQKFLIAKNSRVADLYGQVLDQYGVAVDGVRVIGRLLRATGFHVDEDIAVFETSTDKDGKFSFVGMRGSGFGVAIAHD